MKMKMDKKVKGVVMSAVIIASVFAMGAPAAASYNFDGYELKNMTNGTVQGDVFVSYGDHSGFPTTRTGVYRTNYTLPGGTVRWARLYVGIWGGTATRTGWVNTTLNASGTLHCLGNVTLNGTNDNNPIYSSGTNAYNTGCGCWMVSYNCTDNVTMNTINRAVATTGGQIDGRIYGIVLVVVYENESLAKVQYWINEGNVNLNYITPLNNTVTRFNGTAYNSTEANLTVVYYTGTDTENDYLFLNAPNDTSTSPGNVSQSNIGWDNSSTYWRYQMGNRNVADERVDSCSGSGCGCDDNSINSYGFDFNCFSQTNDSNYMVRDIINTSAANSNYAIFWRGRDDNGNGTIDSSWAASGVEGEAYVHPILAVLRLKNITHVYDFKTGAGTDKWAFEGEVSNRPPSTPDVPTSATVTYSNIEADEGVYEEYTTQNDNNYAAQRFNFSIDETSPTKINVTWNGIGDHGSATDGATLYIYNFTAGAYEQLDSNSVSTDATLTGEKTSSISSYINTGNVTVLVEQNSAHSDPDTSYIATDYIRVVITP